MAAPDTPTPGGLRVADLASRRRVRAASPAAPGPAVPALDDPAVGPTIGRWLGLPGDDLAAELERLRRLDAPGDDADTTRRLRAGLDTAARLLTDLARAGR